MSSNQAEENVKKYRRHQFKPGNPWAIKPGECRNPNGAQINPAVIQARKVLNLVTKWMDNEKVRNKLRKYIQDQAKPAELIRLCLALSDREDTRQRVIEAGALLGLSMSHLAEVIRASGDPDGAKIAEAIDVEAIEKSRKIPPLESTNSGRSTGCRNVKNLEKSRNSASFCNDFSDIGL